MTDPRAMARELLDALPIIFTVSEYGSVQLCNEAEAECIDTIMHALADERRRGMEEAAKHIEQSVSHYDGEECRLGISVFAKCEAEWIRAQAQAGQEGV